MSAYRSPDRPPRVPPPTPVDRARLRRARAITLARTFAPILLVAAGALAMWQGHLLGLAAFALGGVWMRIERTRGQIFDRATIQAEANAWLARPVEALSPPSPHAWRPFGVLAALAFAV